MHVTSSFTAIGNEFHYVRNSIEESVFTPGPLQQEITVQVNLMQKHLRCKIVRPSKVESYLEVNA